jgi:hypothetical protein
MGRCPKCRVWIGPLRRYDSMRADHRLTCHGCRTELRTTGIGALVFGAMGSAVGLVLVLVLWLVIGEYHRVMLGIVGVTATLGAKFLNPLELVPPKSSSPPRSIV